MEVNFNNLRLNACRSYNSLCRKLNEAIHGGYDAEEIQQDMDDLRMYLVGIICTYDEENPKFADMSEKIDLLIFMEEEESKEGER